MGAASAGWKLTSTRRRVKGSPGGERLAGSRIARARRCLRGEAHVRGAKCCRRGERALPLVGAQN
eukprot:7375860-Prymnesium_polylepis.1